MYDFFDKIMDFKDENVVQFVNLSKEEIIDELNKLTSEANQFDKEMKE